MNTARSRLSVPLRDSRAAAGATDACRTSSAPRSFRSSGERRPRVPHRWDLRKLSGPYGSRPGASSTCPGVARRGFDSHDGCGQTFRVCARMFVALVSAVVLIVAVALLVGGTSARHIEPVFVRASTAGTSGVGTAPVAAGRPIRAELQRTLNLLLARLNRLPSTALSKPSSPFGRAQRCLLSGVSRCGGPAIACPTSTAPCGASPVPIPVTTEDPSLVPLAGQVQNG
jgi:hypothetical protein